MKKFAYSLLALLLVLSALALPAAADAAYEATWDYAYAVDYTAYVSAPDGQGLNLRSGPGSEYDTVIDHYIPMNTALHITQETSSSKGSKWGWTEYESEWGWVYLKELSTQPQADLNTQPSAALPAPTAQPSPTRVPEETAQPSPTQTPVAPTPSGFYTMFNLAIIAIVVFAIAGTALIILLTKRNKK